MLDFRAFGYEYRKVREERGVRRGGLKVVVRGYIVPVWFCYSLVLFDKEQEKGKGKKRERKKRGTRSLTDDQL